MLKNELKQYLSRVRKQAMRLASFMRRCVPLMLFALVLCVASAARAEDPLVLPEIVEAATIRELVGLAVAAIGAMAGMAMLGFFAIQAFNLGLSYIRKLLKV